MPRPRRRRSLTLVSFIVAIALSSVTCGADELAIVSVRLQVSGLEFLKCFSANGFAYLLTTGYIKR